MKELKEFESALAELHRHIHTGVQKFCAQSDKPLLRKSTPMPIRFESARSLGYIL